MSAPAYPQNSDKREQDVALAALIAAYQLQEDGRGLRATLPVAGRSLLEYQARQAARIGAAHLVVLVERMPAELLAAIDRLRGDGLRVEIARTVADAADRVHPDEQLLFVGDGCVAGLAWARRVAEARSPTLLTTADTAAGEACERIDGGTRWAGLALLNGARLRRVVAMLGEWDLQSTLLRSMVQEGAQRIDASAGNDLRDPDELWLIADRASALEGLDRRLAARAAGEGRDWADGLISEPVARLVLPWLLKRGAQSWWFAAAALLLTLLAAPLLLFGWRWPGLIALLLAGPLLTIGTGVDRARLLDSRARARMERARDIVASLPLLAFGWSMTAPAGWGAELLALWTVAAMAALRGETAMLVASGGRAPRWIAGVDALCWLFLPLALLGGWLIGLGVIALYASLSFAAVQLQLRRRLRTVTVATQV